MDALDLADIEVFDATADMLGAGDLEGGFAHALDRVVFDFAHENGPHVGGEFFVAVDLFEGVAGRLGLA